MIVTFLRKSSGILHTGFRLRRNAGVSKDNFRMIDYSTGNRGENPPGVGLISTLVVLVTMGALGAIVVSSLPFGGGSSDTQAKSLLNEANAQGDASKLVGAPSPAGQVLGGAAAEANMGGPSAANPPSLPSTARTAACKDNLRTVEAAIATKNATDGAYATSIDELVAGHWLDAAPSMVGYQMTLEVANGQPTGHVLVNGQPGIEGCNAPVSGGK
jgi:hypothetical protein